MHPHLLNCWALAILIPVALLARAQISTSSALLVPDEVKDSIFSTGVELCEAGLPVANAGVDQFSGLDIPVALNGRFSCDPQELPLLFHWFLSERPVGSKALVNDDHSAQAWLAPDQPGIYVVQLVVSNGQDASVPDTTLVQAFRHFGTDSDEDGLSDALEMQLGLNPYNADSFGDGTPDGDRDLDNDRLTNLQELLLGTDPLAADSNANGIVDGDEDFDRDELSNADEFALGTGPLRADSDGDGWRDGEEVANGSNPLNANSFPQPFVVAGSVDGHLLNITGQGAMEGNVASTSNSIVDGHLLLITGAGATEGHEPNTTLARPTVRVDRN